MWIFPGWEAVHYRITQAHWHIAFAALIQQSSVSKAKSLVTWELLIITKFSRTANCAILPLVLVLSPSPTPRESSGRSCHHLRRGATLSAQFLSMDLLSYRKKPEVIRPFSWLITLQNIFYMGSTLIPRSFSGTYLSHVNAFSKPACQGKWNGLVDKKGRWGKAVFSCVKARCCVTGNLPLPFPHSYLRNGEKD